MLTHRELIDIHAYALFSHDVRSRLISVNEPDGESGPAPRLYIGRTCTENVWRFRADLPQDVIEEIEPLCADEPPLDLDLGEPPRHLETYVRLLNQHAPVTSTSDGPAYRFTEVLPPSRQTIRLTTDDADLLQDDFLDMVDELSAWQPFVAVVENGRTIAVCRSVRITPRAHEAGVKTLPEFRGQGYALDVVSEWARLVQAAGTIPLYSTSWKNAASQAVARKLRLEFYGADFQII